MRTLLLTLTYNRFTPTGRALKCFLEQDYKGEHTQVIYNSGEPFQLDLPELPPNKKIILINNKVDLFTGGEYLCVGDKYRDALLSIEPNYDLISFYDSDDIILPNHITEGVKGYSKAVSEGKRAYKPHFSYLNNSGDISLQHNTFEGSIFMDPFYPKQYGFSEGEMSYHNNWIFPLRDHDKILVDPQGKSTFCYMWGELEIPTYKLSGRGDSAGNFELSQKAQNDKGNGILVPWTSERLDWYYRKIREFNGQSNSN